MTSGRVTSLTRGASHLVLSKENTHAQQTAMALVPAASLVGAAALASTTSLAQSVENHGFIAVNYPYCQKKRLGQQVSGRLSRPLSRQGT